MSKFIELSDYDASMHRDILEATTRKDDAIVEICEDRAIEEMRCYLSKRYDCDRIFTQTGDGRSQLVLMMAIDIAIYHIVSIHDPQNIRGTVSYTHLQERGLCVAAEKLGRGYRPLPLTGQRGGTAEGILQQPGSRGRDCLLYTSYKFAHLVKY